MIIVLSLSGLLFFWAVFCCLGALTGVVKLCGTLQSKLFRSQEGIEPLFGGNLILTITVCTLCLAGVQVSLYNHAEPFAALGLSILWSLTVTAGLIDGKRHIIPNELVITGIILRLILWLGEFLYTGQCGAAMTSQILGGALGFGLLTAAALLSRGGLGMGDAKLMGIIGLMAGVLGAYSTLFAGLLVSLCVSVYGLVRKKWGRKTAIPFGPCLAAGYTLTLLLLSY